MIFQELNLVPSRTVAQNIYLGREPGPGRAAVSASSTGRSSRTGRGVLKIVGSKASPDASSSELSVGQQQLVEIAKALSFDAKVLFMDEPTSSLSEEVAAEPARLMRDLRAQGMAIVFTTHRLPRGVQGGGSLCRVARRQARRRFAGQERQRGRDRRDDGRATDKPALSEGEGRRSAQRRCSRSRVCPAGSSRT